MSGAGEHYVSVTSVTKLHNKRGVELEKLLNMIMEHIWQQYTILVIIAAHYKLTMQNVAGF